MFRTTDHELDLFISRLGVRRIEPKGIVLNLGFTSSMTHGK